MKNIGIITYDQPHLKTEQLILSMVSLNEIMPRYKIKVFALPFKSRKQRDVYFNHRPIQNRAVSVEVLCKAFNFAFVPCAVDTDITNDCDLYIVAGANLIDEQALKNKKIINAHPGIIPAARGLDSFKWSILNSIPLGVTLHYIDENVDMGEIISVIPTPVFISDTLETLAKRHYDNEIKILSQFEHYLNNPQNDFYDIECAESNRRMPYDTEVKMTEVFDEYKQKFSMNYSLKK